MRLNKMFVQLLIGLIVLLPSILSATCPDHKSQCPEHTTCCRLRNGQYGCCPLPNAVCCMDHLHCCPHETTCDLRGGRCQKSDGSHVEMSSKLPSLLTREKENEIVCGNHEAKCPSGTTCCKVFGHIWGCCPTPEAVCCKDHIHCCPHHMICDTQHGRCINSTQTLPWVRKHLANKIYHPQPMPSTECKGGKERCMGQSECCAKKNGKPGCCPFSGGVCCANQQTCCPFGFSCEENGLECLREDDEEILVVPQSPLQHSVKKYNMDGLFLIRKVRCPNGSECPHKTTCCPIHSQPGYFSCCPLQKATCCKNICCPENFECAEENKCRKKSSIRKFIDRVMGI